MKDILIQDDIRRADQNQQVDDLMQIGNVFDTVTKEARVAQKKI